MCEKNSFIAEQKAVKLVRKSMRNGPELRTGAPILLLEQVFTRGDIVDKARENDFIFRLNQVAADIEGDILRGKRSAVKESFPNHLKPTAKVEIIGNGCGGQRIRNQGWKPWI